MAEGRNQQITKRINMKSAREYIPDCWVLVHLSAKNDNDHYRFLTSWYGGFTQGDSWKLSSGIIEDAISLNEQGQFVSPQSSGSCYIISPKTYHLSGICANIARGFMDSIDAADSSLVKFEIINREKSLELLNEWARKNS